MDEADALSDRIAIINHGEVKCCGSPIFLKNLYGNGYQLTITKAENFNEKEFLNTVISNISNYKIETNIAGEITISISNEVLSKLPNLLKEIENSQEFIGVNSYGISSSTIEDVFLK
jgi:ATP-binding cassette subfamily A (ABC1) protein 3